MHKKYFYTENKNETITRGIHNIFEQRELIIF